MRRHRYALVAATLWTLSGTPVMAAGQFDHLPWGQKLATVTLLLVGVVAMELGGLALMGLYSVLRPARLRAGGQVLRRHPTRSFIVGVATLFGAAAAGGIAENLPEPLAGLVGITLLIALAYVTVTGFCMAAHEIGERIQSSINAPRLGSAFAAVVWGGALLMVLAFLPILGALVDLVIAVVGVGAAISLLFSRRAGPRPTPASAPPASDPDSDGVVHRSGA